jgi:DNA-binding response OmpR family regulator
MLVRTANLAEVGMAMAELVHELRQPLAGISGFAQLLSNNRSDPSAAGWVQEIHGQVSQMEEMIERLRRFLKPDAGEHEAEEPVDAAQVVAQAVALSPRMPPGSRIEKQIDRDLPRVRAEHNGLVQVLFNLLANAREALEQKGSGNVLLRASASSHGVEIVVADEGTGIAESIAGRLFEPFASSKGDRGTGLGLYVSRGRIRRWGGELRRLKVPPEPYVTAFSVELARAAGPAESPSAQQPVGKAGAAARAFELAVTDLKQMLGRVSVARRVLVVDDEPGLRRAMKVLLSSEPETEILDAADGPAAIRLLSESPAQLLLVDKNLSGMSGLDLLRWARSRELAFEAMVITGYPSLSSVIESAELGARDYLLKPIEHIDALRGQMREALQRQRWRQIVRGLGNDLRPWAERARQTMPAGTLAASPSLRQALGILAGRIEGPARVLVVSEASCASAVSHSGHIAMGPISPGQVLEALEGYDAVLIGVCFEQSKALDLARSVCAATYGPKVLWAIPLAHFDDALVVLRAGANAMISRPVDSKTLGPLLSRIAKAHREETRAQAMQVAISELGIELPLRGLQQPLG